MKLVMNIGMLENLQVALEYKRWDNFHKVIKQAIISCKNSDVDICGQFLEVGKSSINVNGGKRRIIDYKLSRYACYLIAQNSNSHIKAIISANISYSNENYWGVEVSTPINSGKSKIEYIKDYKLTRYACYLIAQNSNSNINANDQFVQVDKLIQHGKSGMRNIKDYKLSRYACYLIA